MENMRHLECSLMTVTQMERQEMEKMSVCLSLCAVFFFFSPLLSFNIGTRNVFKREDSVFVAIAVDLILKN